MALVPQENSDSERRDFPFSKALVKRTVFILLRNAFYAALGRIAIGILKRIGKGGLAALMSSQILEEIFSTDPLKWGFVIGGFSFFPLLKEVIQKCGQRFHVGEKTAVVLSGSICAVPALVMNRETRTDISLYIFVRSLHTFAESYILPILPKPLQEFHHYDVLVMCLSASQILYSVVFAPFSMPPSYQQFLRKASMLDNRVVRGHAGLARYQITPELVEFCMEKGLKIPQSAREHFCIGCMFTHPGMTCNQYFISHIGRHMFQVGFPLYIPLKVGTILLFQLKEVKRRPFKLLKNSIRSLFLSALFLALYSASTVRFACFAAQGNIRGGFFFAICSSFAGIAALLEPKGRRTDLALYCLMYALRSFVITQHRLGRIPYPRQSMVFLVYVVSVGFLFYEYDQEPEKMNSRLRDAFSKLVPSKEFECTERKKPRDN